MHVPAGVSLPPAVVQAYDTAPVELASSTGAPLNAKHFFMNYSAMQRHQIPQ
jgi:hypothetical protein